MKVGQLLLLVAIVGAAFGGMVLIVRSIRGDRHWIMAVHDQPGGMIIRIGTATQEIPKSIESPVFVVRVKGHRLGRDEGPFLLDGAQGSLPTDFVRTHIDTTILPGACRLSMGPLFLDFCGAWLEANGKLCRPGEEIEVGVVDLPIGTQARPVPTDP